MKKALALGDSDTSPPRTSLAPISDSTPSTGTAAHATLVLIAIDVFD